MTTMADVQAEASRSYLRSVLDEAGENISKAARVAGVSRPHFYKLMRVHGIQLRRPMHSVGGNSEWRKLGS